MSVASGTYADQAHYRLEAGPAAPGTIVLLHGLGGDLEQLWGVTGAEVGGRPAAILAPDARGHGQTHLPELGPLDFGVLAADVLSLVDRLHLGRELVLVGVSMGAATALAVALSQAAQVQGLVLVRPAWLHEPWPQNLAPFAEIAALLRDQARRRPGHVPGVRHLSRVRGPFAQHRGQPARPVRQAVRPFPGTPAGGASRRRPVRAPGCPRRGPSTDAGGRCAQ